MSLLGSCLTFPNDDMYRALMRVLVYLGRSPKVGITFSRHQDFKLRCLLPIATGPSRDRRLAIVCSSAAEWCRLALIGSTASPCLRRKPSWLRSPIALSNCCLCARCCKLELGVEFDEPIEVCTDNKGAFDLCHRYTSAQNSRHIDRKLFKMRELRGAGDVTVRHIPTDLNPADLFTKLESVAQSEVREVSPSSVEHSYVWWCAAFACVIDRAYVTLDSWDVGAMAHAGGVVRPPCGPTPSYPDINAYTYLTTR
ncbi:hypothetical protein AB1Y20_002785 [Prymnesium parvum]|uniref:Reverse transcriptase Ty1/copia-type domain-containing protein n=1 Tax=Prymnesium parvum TaxID=97485 RepID=A0AB34J9Z9_PRYPA